ncbi:MAG: DUF4982 domain-containing protein [Lachnospiraceae bacterium]|nr:DUF4982 domain-containing protein [Lachnospiraceae bacterium]
MIKTNWNDGWKFWPDKDAFALVWNIPEQARDITLPHDAMIEKPAYAGSPNMGNTGYRDGGNYTYVKHLTLTKEETLKKYILKFDGVYCHAMVYVNEQLAGSEANGYATFYVNLTPFLREGVNEIRVLVRNAGMTNSRWYSGSGIYRDVTLFTSDAVYLEPDAVYVSTEGVDEASATLSVKTTIINETLQAQTLSLRTKICSDAQEEVGAEATTFFLKAGEKKTLSQRILVKNPALWSEETPVLYAVATELLSGETVIDAACDRFGIRTLSLDAAHGLRVNGKSVKLRGACIHHDSGLLGAATYADAQKRQIRLLKEAGFNAVRISHHPAAPALLRACDELGMYVMDEFSDMWQRPKNDLDYALDFDKLWETDVSLMIKKDFNHPSVVLYSVGNEIPEIGTDAGSETCAKIAGLMKELDPTRYTTAGINGVFAAGDQMGRILADLSRDMQAAGEIDGNVNDFMTVMDTKMDQIVVHDAISERLEKACASLDVAGYNYMTARYEPDSVHYPNRVMVGSETYPPEIARNWAVISKLPCVIGDFTWTGWDYIGEAGVGIPAYAFGEGGFGAQFPCQLAYCGDLDLTGFRRPLSYYREIVFGLRKEPFIAVQDPAHYGQTLIKTPWVMSDAISSWDYPAFAGKPVVVEIYAPGEEAELFLNDTSLGRKPLEGFRALFELTYAPGTLKAVTYKDGICVGETTLSTPDCAGLTLTVDTEGEELIYLTAALADANGVVSTSADEELTAEVSGAKLLGFGSGDPKPSHNYNEGTTKTWNGRAQLILQKECAAPAEVTVKSASGKVATITI